MSTTTGKQKFILIHVAIWKSCGYGTNISPLCSLSQS